MDEIISKTFNKYWHGDEVLKSLDNMKAQLYKNLNDQCNSYWSGSGAYCIMTKGGFLFDGKSCTEKVLTPLGEMFMEEYKKSLKSS